MDVQATGATANAWAFEGRNATNAARHGVFFYYSSGGLWNSDYGGSARVSFPGIALTDRLAIDYNKNICIINGTSVTHTATTFQSSYNLVLLAANTGGTIAGHLKAKLYSCQIYDNGTLIRDYIPCKNESGAVGLWDDVNSVFYGNAGTGAFTAGPEVIHPPTYSPAIMAISITPNPAYVGNTVFISISAMDIAVEPSIEIRGSGEFYSGEV